MGIFDRFKKKASFTSMYTSVTNMDEPLVPSFAEPRGYLLLLIRPSLKKLYEECPTNDPPIDADLVWTSQGQYSASRFTKHMLERLPIIAVCQDATLGYTFPTRLDLKFVLSRLAGGEASDDYPLQLFTNSDVLLISDGAYVVRLFYKSMHDAVKTIQQGTDEFLAAHIMYTATITDEPTRNILRLLESTAENILTPLQAMPNKQKPPKLPPDVLSKANSFFKDVFGRENRLPKFVKSEIFWGRVSDNSR